MARKRLGEILIEAGLLDARALNAGLLEQRRWGGQLGKILVDMRLVSEDALVKALSHQLNFPTVELERFRIAPEVVELVAGEIAERHNLIPFNREGKFLDVAMSDPTNLGIIDELRIRTQLNVRPYLAGPKVIERNLARYYGRGAGVLEEAAGDEQNPPEVSPAPPDGFDANTPTPDPPITTRDAEIVSLQKRISSLEALVARDEDVLRKLLGLLVEKGVATRDEILDRIK